MESRPPVPGAQADLKVSVGYVSFTNGSKGGSKLPFGVYSAQVNTTTTMAASIRAALEVTGQVPEVRVQLETGRVLHMALLQPGRSPVDTKYHGMRVPRLLRVTTQDEVSMLGVAEVLRCMRARDMIQGVSWVGSGAEEGAESGSALALPEGALTMGAMELHAAMKQQAAEKLQLPSWAPALGKGERVALVWGADKQLVEQPWMTVEWTVCADAAPAGSSLHGRTSIPFTFSYLQPGLKAAAKPAAGKSKAAPGSYAAAAREESTGGVQGAQGAPAKEAALALHTVQEELAAALKQAQSSQAEIAALQAKLAQQQHESEEQIADARADWEALLDQRANQQQLQEQLEAERAAFDAEYAKWVDDQQCVDERVNMRMEELNARSAQLVEERRLAQCALSLLSPIAFPTADRVQPPNAQSTFTVLARRCRSTIQSSLTYQQMQVPEGVPDSAVQQAVEDAATCVTNLVLSKWGWEAVASWVGDKQAAPGTFTRMVFLSFMPIGWICHELTGTGPLVGLPSPAKGTKATHPLSPAQQSDALPQAASKLWTLVTPDIEQVDKRYKERSVQSMMAHNLELLARAQLEAAGGQAAAAQCDPAVMRAWVSTGYKALTAGRHWEDLREWLMVKAAPPDISQEQVWEWMQSGAAVPHLTHA
jgi:hypothetical protein